MQTANIRSLLEEVSTTVRELHGILSTEMPANAPYWERVAKEAEYLATEGTPRDAEQFARRVAGSFGVGMGSFSDIYINDRFDSLRDALAEQLARIEDSARNVGGVDRAKVRTFLVRLETALLDAGMAEAKDVRDVFMRDELDYEAARAIMRRLRRDETRWPPLHRHNIRAALDLLLAELGDGADFGPATPDGGGTP